MIKTPTNFAAKLAIIAAGAALPLAVFAANNADIDTKVYFVKPITVTAGDALDFGYLNKNATNGDAWTVPTNGGVAAVGSGTAGFDVSQGSRAPGSVTVDSDAALPIQVGVDTVAGTGYDIAGFTCEYPGVSNTVSGNCTTGTELVIPQAESQATVQTLHIGGTLTVSDAGALLGSATQTVATTVTVTYQ